MRRFPNTTAQSQARRRTFLLDSGGRFPDRGRLSRQTPLPVGERLSSLQHEMALRRHAGASSPSAA